MKFERLSANSVLGKIAHSSFLEEKPWLKARNISTGFGTGNSMI